MVNLSKKQTPRGVIPKPPLCDDALDDRADSSNARATKKLGTTLSSHFEIPTFFATVLLVRVGQNKCLSMKLTT